MKGGITNDVPQLLCVPNGLMAMVHRYLLMGIFTYVELLQCNI